VFASPEFVNSLRNTKEVTKFLSQEDFNGKDINFQIMKYQGRTIVEVSPERLRTNISLYSGGYTWGAESKGINYLMVAKSSVIHVVKYEKVKVIGDDLNLAGQGFDGYTIFARIYHDVFVPDNKRYALYCSLDEEAEAPKMALDVLVANGKVKSISTYPGEKLAFVITGGDYELGATIPTGTALTMTKVGDAVTSTTKFYAIDSNRKVLAAHTHTVA
jgi:hypothetical protein